MKISTKAFILVLYAVALFGCGASGPSNSNTNSNSAANGEIKLDPANMPPGLSAQPLPSSANLPPGISLNANVVPGNARTPGIPSAEELKKPFKPGRAKTPGIPDPETLRRQMSVPVTNTNALTNQPTRQR